ncbi:hypothetical protein L207DRAFT_627675 [Hyaloscypha variabilis F]|uniref:Tat pathway signal sequence n=1 Tax=Hyaloscypha variabilis (strain UAMH 11265 / GT02V1 / F) TaxID=1149755 RepID=A0A2J6SE60_HYAVF|nr:hypothetical protein L207DRAFT_627675 [Hyaloscypha variabilis F]
MPYKKVQPLLAEDVEIQDSSTEDLPLYEYPRKHRNCCTNFRSRPPHWPWMLSTVFFACTTILLLIHSPVRLTRFALNLQKYGLSSELEAARESIEYEDIIWTSGIEENDNGQMYLNLPPGPKYIGAPSREIDEAWLDLTKATEIWVTGDEAKSVENRTIQSEHGWLVSLDTYHSLHCVNLARRGFDWDYYYGDKPGQERITSLTRDHIYHCLEHLRQAAMCHGDLTPMRFQWMEHNEKTSIPIWTEPHTCRNWEKIRTWAEARKRNPKEPLVHYNSHGH